MRRYQDLALATIGGTTLPLAGASVEVYLTGTLTVATIYSDNLATPTAKANPVTAGTDGRYFFYAPSGRYDISISKPGYSTYQLTDVLFDEPRETSGSNAIASATALVLLTDRDDMQVTGTTSITSISTATKGRTIRLMFTGILTFTDGNNLKLAGNLVTTADDTITLTCFDGTNWHEMGRAVN